LTTIYPLLHQLAKTRELPQQLEHRHPTLYGDPHQPQGLVTTWTNALHPHALYFAGYVDPTSSNFTSISQQILTDVTQQALSGHHQSLITRDFAPQHPFNLWLTKHEFYLIRTTYLPQLTLTTTGLPDAHATVLSAAQVLANPKLCQQLSAWAYQDYAQTHLNKPVISQSPEAWQARIFRDQILEAPLALMVNEHLEAWLFSFADSPTSVAIAWPGERHSGQLDHLLPVILNWLQRQFHTLTGEFDTTDPLAMHLQSRLPFPPTAAYMTYQRQLPISNKRI